MEINRNTIENEVKQKAILVCMQYPEMNKGEALIHLTELENLVDTMGAESVKSIVVPLKKRSPKFFVGSGKADEITETAKKLGAEIIIFDNDLSPGQQRNFEELSGKAVIDRHEVILDIFAERATTKEAVLQVGLARMEYSLPRLTRAWTHLSRQKGGSKGTRGEGETQLEVDRRLVMNKITRLKKELIKVRLHRNTLRKQRSTLSIPTGALVGYTNAGKSSLLNALTGADAFVEDKLFATLDPTTRKVTLPGGHKILLTDTVGFIRKLPHDLVDAFKSTLEETVLADFLIHVLDLSLPEVEEQYRITMEVLEELGAGDKPMILVFNKIDLNTNSTDSLGIELNNPDALYISTKTEEGLDSVFEKVEEFLNKDKKTISLLIPTDRYDLISMIHREGTVLEEDYQDSGSSIKARVPVKVYNKLKSYITENQ
ncbi:MAG: GTPase HflX [Spirochaetia bacterium]|jgi:GTP-binding protein HflX|nr:GTPase HflX [Spirochaetia bacterium]